MHSWYTLTNLGDIVSIPFSEWMIYTLNIDWSIPFGIFLAAIFLSALGIKLFVKDIQIQPEEGDRLTVLKENYSIIKQSFKKVKNFLWLLDACFI